MMFWLLCLPTIRFTTAATKADAQTQQQAHERDTTAAASQRVQTTQITACIRARTLNITVASVRTGIHI